jgi:hypothetical protein
MLISELRCGGERRPESIHSAVWGVQGLYIVEVLRYRSHFDDTIPVFRVQSLYFGSSVPQGSLVRASKVSKILCSRTYSETIPGPAVGLAQVFLLKGALCALHQDVVVLRTRSLESVSADVSI